MNWLVLLLGIGYAVMRGGSGLLGGTAAPAPPTAPAPDNSGGSGSDGSGGGGGGGGGGAAEEGRGGDDVCLNKLMCKAESNPHARAQCLLGVGRGATKGEVRKAHRKLAVLCHEDKAGEYKDLSKWVMTAANEAKELLGGGGGGNKGAEGQGQREQQGGGGGIPQNVLDKFRLSDTNGDGLISASELSSAVGGRSRSVPIMKALDKDADGHLSMDEFARLF